MNLLQQLDEAAGRRIPIHYAEDLRREFGMERKPFYGRLERIGRLVDMRAFVAGEIKPSGALLILISDHRGGLLIQLWELRDDTETTARGARMV